ncbi:hypothetical protein [Sediminibacter sp. Hel_I_10]|uniref:hypothetical protein n=1 Tax=Sediminibacter sp. Hel_I_10 TaxID=1392490 RepID=UPI0004795964|nr:hypothetical protein [Sediminibacter sp. Hel_I_10]
MYLEIKNANNFFKVKGTLNKKNVHLFENEFKSVLEMFNAITVSLEDLVNIDRHGIKAISRLQNEALSKNKRLSIIGAGNSNLYSHFKAAETAA